MKTVSESELAAFLAAMETGDRVVAGSETHRVMSLLSAEARRVTARLNRDALSPEDIRACMAELTGRPVAPTFRLFPPFHTDCGKNLRIGKNVFINAGCHAQDQGGLTLGDGCLIGHGVIFCTLNHAPEPERRGDMLPAPIVLGRDVWVGAGARILPGVTVGDGAIVGAGAVVTRDVPPRTVVAGVPARVIKTLDAPHPNERNATMNKPIATLLAAAALAGTALAAPQTPAIPEGAANFYRSDRVETRKVAFPSQFGLFVAGTLCLPKDAGGARLPTLIVGHPMGAVKEQAATLYATRLAEQGFAAVAIDLLCWGESEGPRNLVSPDLYAESFSAAVDWLVTQPFADPARIGAIGVCGSGSFALAAAKIDPRIKAVATASMYDMGAAARHGLKAAPTTLEARKALCAQAAAQRTAEARGAAPAYVGGTVLTLAEATNPIALEFYGWYRTPRGEYTPAGATRETTTKPTLASNTRFMNFYPFEDLDLIAPRPLLFIAGDRAHSREFSEEAYRRASEPKRLLIVPDANHVDLYDRLDRIPFADIAAFFQAALR